MPASVVQIPARLPPSLYAQIAEGAKVEGLSLNALVVKALEVGVTDHEKAKAQDRPQGR